MKYLVQWTSVKVKSMLENQRNFFLYKNYNHTEDEIIISNQNSTRDLKET